MTNDDGQMVTDVVHRPITYKEKSEEDRRDLQEREESGEEQVVTMLHEDDGDWAKRELVSLSVDIIPENKLDDYYFTHYTREGSPTEKEMVFGDIECEIDDSRTFTPNLICCERESSEAKYHIWGKSCIRQCIGQLMEWTK